MIVEIDGLILQTFQRDDGETREEVLMNVMIHQPVEREAQRVQANREELVEWIARAMREDGTVLPLRCATCNGCGKRSALSQADEPD